MWEKDCDLLLAESKRCNSLALESRSSSRGESRNLPWSASVGMEGDAESFDELFEIPELLCLGDKRKIRCGRGSETEPKGSFAMGPVTAFPHILMIGVSILGREFRRPVISQTLQ
jgi:hypothetical protein